MQFTQDTLMRLCIHELRTLARKTGVRSPTSQKKEFLVDQILKISSGQEKAPVVSNRGRKPMGGNMQTLVDVFIRKENDTEETLFAFHTSEEEEGFNKKLKSIQTEKEYTEAAGSLEVVQSGYGFLRKKCLSNALADVFVAPDLVQNKNLKAGDFVSLKCKKVVDKDLYIATEILDINQKKLVVCDHFEKLPARFSQKQILFGSDLQVINHFTPVMTGQRVLVVSDNLLLLNDSIVKMYHSCKSKNKFLLKLDCLPEELAEETDFNIVLVSALEDRVLKQNKILHVYAYMKRLAELGEDVVLFMNNLNKLADIFDGPYAKNLLERIKSFLGLAKSTENASFTLIAGTTQMQSHRFTDIANTQMILNEKLTRYFDGFCIDLFKINLLQKNNQQNINRLKELLRNLKEEDFAAQVKVIEKLS